MLQLEKQQNTAICGDNFEQNVFMRTRTIYENGKFTEMCIEKLKKLE
jgi:hypothetical protein